MKYRKKPVVVEAIQWTGDNYDEICKFVGKPLVFNAEPRDNSQPRLAIDTLEGEMTATVNDYIIKGVKGEFYPCKPDIFLQTYEEVKEGADVGVISGYQPYGCVTWCHDETFELDLDVIKSIVLEKIIELMRKEAVENPDFFIINRESSCDPLSSNSVGLKVYLPKRRTSDGKVY